MPPLRSRRGSPAVYDLDGAPFTIVGLIFFACFIVLVGADLVLDEMSEASVYHLATEALLFVIGVGLLVLMVLRLQSQLRATRRLQRDLDSANAEARRWREESQEILRGLGEAIDRQFQRWALTPAEAEIGLLLLKGFSHKEIAGVRETSERTVRQQARSLYAKGGLAGRSELSAFFLEDLLVASQSPPERTAEQGA